MYGKFVKLNIFIAALVIAAIDTAALSEEYDLSGRLGLLEGKFPSGMESVDEFVSIVDRVVTKLVKELNVKNSLVTQLKKENIALKTEFEKISERVAEKEKDVFNAEKEENRKSFVPYRKKSINRVRTGGEGMILKEGLKGVGEKVLSAKEDDRRSRVHEDMGTSYIRLKKYDEAIEAYVRALRFNSNNPRTHYNLGILYEYLHKDSTRAVYHLRKSLQLCSGAKEKEKIEYLIRVIKRE